MKGWYDLSHPKNCIAKFDQSKPQHFVSLRNSEVLLGSTKTEELYKDKNLDALKDYISSF